MVKTTTATVAGKKPAAKKALAKAAAPARVGRSVSASAAAAAEAALPRKTSYAALVRRLAKDYGVKVASAPAASPINPYRTSEAVTKKALQGAGVLTRCGNLAPHLK